MRVRGLEVGPGELMQGMASFGLEAYIYGGTDAVTADDNILRSLDLSFLFFQSPSKNMLSPLTKLSSDFRYTLKVVSFQRWTNVNGPVQSINGPRSVQGYHI